MVLSDFQILQLQTADSHLPSEPWSCGSWDAQKQHGPRNEESIGGMAVLATFAAGGEHATSSPESRPLDLHRVDVRLR